MKRLLIANRGEIALRIARAANAEGLTTLGIFSEDDVQAPHTRQMDALIPLTGVGPAAYLDIEQIVQKAVAAGADAVHPGYGLLSENAAFGRAVEAAGMVFVGPTPEVLAQLGDKLQALELAKFCSVPVLALSDETLDVAKIKSWMKSGMAGSQVLIKAKAGGGGRGIRVISDPDSLDDIAARAASEAKSAFGSDELYAERYLENARHVEIQIIGDGTGAVSHLWDRDCSLQRRHQKLIEIAPSPNLSDAIRDALFDAAKRMAAAVNYRGVGTFEFLVDPKSESFYFIEANARLQVEHTVTEAVLGIDLVKAQLAIADGQTLSDSGLEQADIPAPKGTAIQARILLESLRPGGMVIPSTGTLTAYDPPEEKGIRVDDCGHVGYQTNPAFDSLVAKVIAHDADGDLSSALALLSKSLDDFALDGAASNLDMQQRLISDPRVDRYDVSTQFIDRHMDEFLATPQSDALLDPLAVLSSPAAFGDAALADLPTHIGEQAPLTAGLVSIDAPMPGKLVSLAVQVGDEVASGQTVAILESMKMEHEVKADQSGVVDALPVLVGDPILEGQRLIHLTPQAVSAAAADDAEALDLDHIRPDLQEALDRIGAAHDENRPKAVEKRKARGHRTARENIADLCDPGSFVEYGSVVLAAQRRRREMADLIANTTGDGMVCGLGHVNGDLFPETQSRIMAMSYDYMVLAGTQGALNHYKKDRMFELAEAHRLPTVLYAEGGGGRPGDTDTTGVAGLDCLAFNYFARLSGLVPTIGIVNGRCFAGNAVLLGCCDVIIATESANIGIGGPAMIEGGGLGVFTPEEVGPIDVQVPNGVVDIAVKDEAEATAAAKKYLSYFQGAVDTWEAPDARELRFAVPENRLRWYDMKKVITGIADIDSVLELRPSWGIGVYTALIRVEGRPLGVIANNPGHLSGAIDSPGADKAARFMQLCDAYDLPVLSLIDCPGIMVGPEIEKTALVRHASRLMVVGANVDIPLICVVIRKGYGLGAQAMAGGSFRTPAMMVTWPTGEFGGMGLEGAVKLGYRKELEALEDIEERRALYDDLVAKSYERGKAINMASHFEVDDVIDPADTRTRIMAVLKSLPPKPMRKEKKRPNVDTW